MVLDPEMTLGEFLRYEREKRSITIEQVASATRVGVRTLHHLEEDQYTDLPAKPFIRGFVTSYCRFIGLEPKEVLNHYSQFMNEKLQDRPDREAGHSGYVFEKKGGEQQQTILFVSIVIFMLMGGVSFFLLKPTLQRPKKSRLDQLKASYPAETPSPGVLLDRPALPSSTELTALLQTRGLSTSNQLAPRTALSSSQATSDPEDPLDSGVGLLAHEIRYKVIAKTLEDLWVRFQVDERAMRKFRIRKGHTLVLRARDRLWLQVSNAKAMTVSVNSARAQIFNTYPSQKQIQQTATLILPEQLTEKINEYLKLQAGVPLPPTPDPQLLPELMQGLESGKEDLSTR